MVDFIITDFSNVRGGGNIVDTVPSPEDFIVDNCTISSSSSGEFVLTPGASLVDSVSLSVSPLSVTVGGSVVLTATVLDDEDEPLEDVLVSFYRSGTVIGSDTSDSTGVASFTATMSSVGSFTLTAVAGGVSSSSVTVTVSKVASTISLSAQSSSVLVGSDVVLNGTLSVGSGESVKILQRGTLIDTVTTTSGGAFTETVSNLGVGNYNFYAVYEGNSVYDEVTSSAVSVTVSDVTPTPVVTSVSLTSDKSILSAYDSESAVLSATVLDQSSNPMSGETVTFYKGSTSMGTATTNSSGIATKSYSSTGAGDVTFKATCESIDSSTITVEDCYYVNTGETSSLTIDSGVTCTVEDGAIKITKSSSGEKFVTCKYSYVSDNHEITFTVPTISSSTNVPLGFAVYTSGGQIYWAGYNKSQGKFDSKGGAKTVSLSAGDTIRIVKSGSNLTAYVNNTSISSVSTATSGIRLAFYTNKGYIQYIDDIKVKKT